MESRTIRFFEIPASDYTNKNFAFTITDPLAIDSGQIIAKFMRNRNLVSSWITTGSKDINNTELLADFGGDSASLSSIFLVKHNLKSFTLEYFNGVAWFMFADIADNDLETTEHAIPSGVTIRQIRLIITATMIADKDKKITQFLAVNTIGKMSGFPQITSMTHTQSIKKNRMLSGKFAISNSVGATNFSLKLKVMDEQSDVDLVESIFYTYQRGVMVYINGGSQEQFRVKARGYRLEDFYVVKPSKDYRDDFYKSLYGVGTKLAITLQEVV